ncbi:MAG TPA: protein kinase [Gemmataceae bacterium]|jgi:Tol biopolymer transport system component/DNA-binding winged helix-turn-helix (wHTH) protein
MPASNTARSAQFGAFRLDLRALELTKGRTRIRVPEQSLQILAMLLESPGEIVSREEVQARLWPNGTIVEFEHSINAAINRLRMALGDSADKPRFIETLPRRGYRFIFPLEPASDRLAEAGSPCQEYHASGDLVGQKISHFRVLAKVGQGAMGVVYKAEDLRLNRTVALKFLTEELSTDPKAQERFQREARAASALNHRNICTIYEVDEHDGFSVIAMEYMAGKSLDQLIGGNRITVDELVSYALQATDALAAAHTVGVIHRDLKPSNIMVGADGQLKVLDFGLAKIEHREPRASRTDTLTTNPGVVMGTVRYMSPEQALGRDVDQRSDIFSLGVVLYELAAGHPPFLGDTPSAIIDAILHSTPTPLRRLNPELSPQIARIIERALEKNPDLRYQTAVKMRADLDGTTRLPKRAGIPDASRKSRLKWLAALTAFVLIASGLWWRLGRSIPDSHGAPRIIPLTSDPGFQELPAFSPDGKRVAYTWDGENGDNPDIYVKAVEGGRPLRLTTDPAYDGDASWSPDGKFLAVVDQETSDKPLGIALLSIETGEKRRLTSPPNRGTRDELPKFSPDGRKLAFLRLRNLVSADLYVLSITAGSLGQPRRLTFDGQADIWGLDWTSDGRNIVFSSWGPGSSSSSSSLWSIPATGGTPQRVALTAENVSSLSVSRAGNRLVYTHGTGVANIWRIPGPNSPERTAPPTKLTTSKQSDREPAFSPDGKSIAFASIRTGNPEIWICDSDGHNPLPVTSLNGPMVGSPRWSPDGRAIAFDSTKEGSSNIYVVNVAGGPVRQVTAGPSNDVRPSWSRDGKWIYFGSDRSGDWQVWKVSVHTGATFQVTKRGGRDARESADGKFIYYAKLFAAPGIWRVPAEGGEETNVLDQGHMGQWTLTNQGIFLAEGSVGTNIKLYALADRRLTTIKKFPRDAHVVDCPVVSPDGRWILYTQSDRAGPDLMLVENYRDTP